MRGVGSRPHKQAIPMESLVSRFGRDKPVLRPFCFPLIVPIFSYQKFQISSKIASTFPFNTLVVSYLSGALLEARLTSRFLARLIFGLSINISMLVSLGFDQDDLNMAFQQCPKLTEASRTVINRRLPCRPGGVRRAVE